MSPRLVILLSAALVFTGCSVTNDLGRTCTLKRKATDAEIAADPNGPRSRDILMSELAPDQDYISFGVTDCDDLICIRDAEAQLEPGPKGEALGYCSRACPEGKGPEVCEVTDTGAIDKLEERIACRSLLLDTKTLERLRLENPDEYRRTFGETLSPFFCAGTIDISPDD
jgi:hypothetical protein